MAPNASPAASRRHLNEPVNEVSTMPDEYIAGYDGDTQKDSKFAPMPAGPQQLVCVDGILLGMTVEQFQTNPPKIVTKWAYVFQSADFNPATGKRYEVHQEFNVSMFETAKLRKFLESWRGVKYTEETARKVSLGAPVGQNAFANISNRTSAAGRAYGVIDTIMPLPKGFTPIAPEGYERASFWEDRKRDYQAKAEAFLAMQDAQKAAASSAPPKSDEQVLAGVAAAEEAEGNKLPF
jgi:hypothetical protein